jgi:Resolvase, N terminal domain
MLNCATDHTRRRIILYARVSTERQASDGYSLAQQMEALREHSASEGYEVLEEVVDRGHSGATLQRPGLDHVRRLVAGGGVSAVLAQDRDRIARESTHHQLLQRELNGRGCELKVLNNLAIADDRFAEYEQAKIVERTWRGKLRKAREGRIVAVTVPNYGFRFNATRDGYEVYEDKMRGKAHLLHGRRREAGPERGEEDSRSRADTEPDLQEMLGHLGDTPLPPRRRVQAACFRGSCEAGNPGGGREARPRREVRYLVVQPRALD